MAMASEDEALPTLRTLVQSCVLPMIQEAAPGDYPHVKFGYVRTCGERHQHPHRGRRGHFPGSLSRSTLVVITGRFQLGGGSHTCRV